MRIRPILILLIACWFCFLLQNCKPEKNLPPVTQEPDSLFLHTPVNFAVPNGFPYVQPPANNQLSTEGIRLGRMLFYDPVLSSDSTYSCSSCHQQQYAFADGGKALSTNIFGLTKRNTPALFNLLWYNHFFWDGRADSLTGQISDALQHEQNFIAPSAIPKLEAQERYTTLFKKAFGMPGNITETKITRAIAQFLMTLVSSNSRFDKVQRGELTWTQAELNGFNLFLADTVFGGADCFHCHSANASASILTLNDNRFHNNALIEATDIYSFADAGRGGITGAAGDYGKFRTPQLRNIEVTGPYMHDGRYNTLEQVVNFYNDSLKNSPTTDPFMKASYRGGLHYLTEQNKQDLIAFLKMLTDDEFLHNPDYSNPFH